MKLFSNIRRAKRESVLASWILRLRKRECTMSSTELTGYKKAVEEMIESLIGVTSNGGLKWEPSRYVPQDMSPFARILECYEAKSGSTAFYIYKRLIYPEQRPLALNPVPSSENVIEAQIEGGAVPIRYPYVPLVDELILLVSKRVLTAQAAALPNVLAEIRQLAKLAAKTPQFFNPLDVFAAEKIRDKYLTK